MARSPNLSLVLAISTLSAIGCGGGGSSQGSTRTTASGSSSSSSALSDTVTPLAGDTLRGRLPRGTVAPAAAPSAIIRPGFMVQSVHVVQRSQGNIKITAKDIGKSAGEDFATKIVENERRARCAGAEDAITPATSAPAPAGLEAVLFTPETACEGATAPAARLWVKSTDASVLSIVFECEAEGCIPDRTTLLDAFIGSLAAGTPTPTAAGPRTFGPSDAVTITVNLPEGFLVRGSESEGTTMFEIFKRHALGEPSEGVSFTFLTTPSGNAVRDDYARPGARTRNVNGVFATHRTRFVEHTFDGNTERIGRIEAGSMQLDAVAIAATEPALTELMTIVSDATVQTGAPAAAPATP